MTRHLLFWKGKDDEGLGDLTCKFGEYSSSVPAQLPVQIDLNPTENDRRGNQEVCSDCEPYGLKNQGLKRSECKHNATVLLFCPHEAAARDLHL